MKRFKEFCEENEKDIKTKNVSIKKNIDNKIKLNPQEKKHKLSNLNLS